MIDLRGKNFLKIEDFKEEELRYLLNLSKQFKEKKKNHEVHEYFQIDDVVVWGVVTDDIPVLRSQIIEYLYEFE